MFFAYLTFPDWIKPEIIPGVGIGSWYGMMYIFSFAGAWLLFNHIIKQKRMQQGLDPYDNSKKKHRPLLHQSKHFGWLAYPYKTKYSKIPIGNFSSANASNFITWLIVGLIIGARIFSALIYANNSDYYWTHPWMIFWPFENGEFVGLRGMSYHGGAVGVGIAGFIFCYKHRLNFLEWGDSLIVAVPLGYTFGRLGNFINQELYGRVTTSPIGMVFDPPGMETFSSRQPWAQEMATELGISPYGIINLPRHPTQLYEAFFEGIVLWAILWFFVSRIKRHNGQMIGSYILGYGLFRFLIEYYRQPDSNLGYIINFTSQNNLNIAVEHPLGAISMGQILCFIMIVIGIVTIVVSPYLDRKTVVNIQRRMERDAKQPPKTAKGVKNAKTTKTGHKK